jgi:sugar lactone lactonase YvrE
MANYLSKPTGNYALELGEGPVWNPISEQLSIVDIFDRQVYIFKVDGEKLTEIECFACDGDIGAALPTSDGGFVLCQNNGIFFRDSNRSITKVCDLPVEGKQFRCNDAKLGPDGKLWVGIMDYDATPKSASLWRINRSGASELLLSDLTIPNGMDWVADDFWFVDGPTEEIKCYKFDESGLVFNGKRIATRGTPDGLTIDSNGEIWLALWGEGRVDHFDKSGTVQDSIAVDSPHSTSLCFAGVQLNTLVMTSALFNMRAEALAKHPQAGDLFTVQLQITGKPANLNFV